MDDRDVTIDWQTAREANLNNWEDRVPIHEQGYGLERFVDSDHQSSVVTADLLTMSPFLPNGSVKSLDVCHLQCHIGTDTLSLARAGASVTGVDFSPAALAAAKKLADSLSLSAQWVLSDVLAARKAVEGDFDLVYTSIGTITWLGDLKTWAQQIYELLRPGGIFFIRDGHPSLYSLDEDSDHLEIRYRYFNTDQAEKWDGNTTYSGEGEIRSERTYQWPHPISEILNALVGAGLRILKMEEGQVLPWEFSKRMEKVDGGWAWVGAERLKVPVSYTFIAIRD